MKYLAIRQTKQTRRDGSTLARASWVHKTRKYGKVISETCISSRKSILIVGANASGKTRCLDRLHAAARGIWGATRGDALRISGLSPIAQWCDNPIIRNWYESRRVAAIDAAEAADGNDAAEPPPPFSQLKQYERADLLRDYLAETRAVLLLDDAHKLTGRKMEIARGCVLAADIWVIAASEETRLGTNLRGVVMRREPQTLRLNTDASYDATAILVYFLIAVTVVGGWYEVAFILGGLRALGAGRRASRAD